MAYNAYKIRHHEYKTADSANKIRRREYGTSDPAEKIGRREFGCTYPANEIGRHGYGTADLANKIGRREYKCTPKSLHSKLSYLPMTIFLSTYSTEKTIFLHLCNNSLALSIGNAKHFCHICNRNFRRISDQCNNSLLVAIGG